jgi:hypothetical protein
MKRGAVAAEHYTLHSFSKGTASTVLIQNFAGPDYESLVFRFTFLAPFSVAPAALLTPFSVPLATALPLCFAARPVDLPASLTS